MSAARRTSAASGPSYSKPSIQRCHARVVAANPGVEARNGLAVVAHNLGTLAMVKGDDEAAFPRLEAARAALQDLAGALTDRDDPSYRQIIPSNLAKSLDNRIAIR